MADKTSLIELTPVERKLAERVDSSVAGGLAIQGGVAFASMDQVMEFAKLMATSNIGVRKHLRGNPGACLAVCIQALEWQMSPFAVANKSYLVNDQIAYEAQLVHAVVLKHAPINGRVRFEFDGEGDKRTCRVWAELRDYPGQIVDYVSPQFAKIQPKNSPLWKTNPDQQQGYHSVLALARRHFPDIILGVYTDEELPQRATIETRAEGTGGGMAGSRIEDTLDQFAGTEAEELMSQPATRPNPPLGANDPDELGPVKTSRDVSGAEIVHPGPRGMPVAPHPSKKKTEAPSQTMQDLQQSYFENAMTEIAAFETYEELIQWAEEERHNRVNLPNKERQHLVDAIEARKQELLAYENRT